MVCVIIYSCIVLFLFISIWSCVKMCLIFFVWLFIFRVGKKFIFVRGMVEEEFVVICCIGYEDCSVL